MGFENTSTFDWFSSRIHLLGIALLPMLSVTLLLPSLPSDRNVYCSSLSNLPSTAASLISCSPDSPPACVSLVPSWVLVVARVFLPWVAAVLLATAAVSSMPSMPGKSRLTWPYLPHPQHQGLRLVPSTFPVPGVVTPSVPNDTPSVLTQSWPDCSLFQLVRVR